MKRNKMYVDRNDHRKIRIIINIIRIILSPLFLFLRIYFWIWDYDYCEKFKLNQLKELNK